MEPVSVQELYNEFHKDKDFLEQFGDGFFDFKTKMLSFILGKTLVLEILRPEPITVSQLIQNI